MELVEPVGDVGVIVEEADPAGAPGAAAAQEPALTVGERAEQELRDRPGLLDEVGPCKPPPRFRERRQGEPVPGRDRLVVERRLRAARAKLEQARASLRVQLAAQDETPVLEGLEQLLRSTFARRPRVGEALDPVGVRVLRGGEAALLEPQRAEHVLDRLLRDLAVALVAGDEPAVQVGGDEQRVVVEHLLEVRAGPALVDRVAMEAAADEVVHPAGRHLVAASARQVRAHRGGATARARRRAGTSARARTRPTPGRTAPRAAAPPGRAPTPSAARPTGPPRPPAPGPRPAPGPPSVRRRGARGRGPRRPRAPAGTTAARGAAPAGSTCRRETARRRASGRRSAANRPARSSPRPRPCRSRRGPAAPRGRP